MATKPRAMTVKEYEALLAAGNANAALDPKIKQQMLMAEYMRQGNRPQGRQAGAVFVAPHPLELAGGLAREYVANRKSADALKALQEQQTNKQAQQALMLKALMGQAPAPEHADPPPHVPTGGSGFMGAGLE